MFKEFERNKNKNKKKKGVIPFKEEHKIKKMLRNNLKLRFAFIVLLLYGFMVLYANLC